MEFLDPEALEEISQLQENILQTLRKELRKLKEPEVMGASNVSSPRFEIGQDMTPLPSLHGSAITMLQPVRRYSPVRMYSKQKYKLAGQQRSKGIMRKKSMSSTASSSTRKYDYGSRNYPRPWAETPRRRRTLSDESLEVHVTSSHFSDLSTLSLLAQEQEEGLKGMENEIFLSLPAPVARSLTQGPARPTQSCEKWHNTVKYDFGHKSILTSALVRYRLLCKCRRDYSQYHSFRRWVNSKKHNNKTSSTSKPRPIVRRSMSRHFRYSSRPKTQIIVQENQDHVPTTGAVIFPPPVVTTFSFSHSHSTILIS